MTGSAGDTAYTPPRIEDHGSLVDLTADFDLHFVGSVAKVLTIAVVSGPVTGGGDPPDGGTSMNSPPEGATPGTPDPGTDVPESPDGSPGGEQEDGPRGAVEPERESGVGLPSEGPTDAPASGGGAVPGVAPASDGGGLPFTGYVAWAWAATGAAMTTAGLALRQGLKRGG